MPQMTETDVLIAGAGPVGLTLAIDLAWRGIGVTVVETRARAAPPEPKCNHVAARTMEIFRRLRDRGKGAERRFAGGLSARHQLSHDVHRSGTDANSDSLPPPSLPNQQRPDPQLPAPPTP